MYVCICVHIYIYAYMYVMELGPKNHTEDVFLLLNSILLVQFSMDPLGLCSDTYSSKKSGCF